MNATGNLLLFAYIAGAVIALVGVAVDVAVDEQRRNGELDFDGAATAMIVGLAVGATWPVVLLVSLAAHGLRKLARRVGADA